MTATAAKTATLGLASATVALLLFARPCCALPQVAPCSVPPPHIDNGSYVEVKEERLALYHCNEGFWLKGPAKLTCVSSAEGKDTWQPDRGPECLENKGCPEIDLKGGGYDGECCAPNDNVTFFCNDDERYYLLGAAEAICQANGTWSLPIPTCEDTYCPDPGVSPQGDRLIYLANEEYEGECCPPETTIYYECKDGYNLEGEKKIRCGLNRTWSDRRPMCRPKDACDHFDVVHGQVSGQKSGGEFFTWGDSAFVKCDRGFRVNGTDQLYCDEDGLWDYDIPTCVESNCTRFEPGPHLQVDEFKDMHKTQFTEGTFINFRCEEGYLLDGAFSSVCGNGGWRGQTPKCEQIRCGVLRVPQNGWITGNNSTAVGVTASFGCFQGYVLMGPNERQCDNDGQWDKTPARCVPKEMKEARDRTGCLDPGAPDNGFQVGRSNFRVGSDVTFACQPGYHMRGNATISCREDKEWSAALPLCIGKFYYDKKLLARTTLDGMAAKIPAVNATSGKDSDASQRVLSLNDSNAPRHFVYFLFDASASIGPTNFQTGINLAKAITRKVNVTVGGHRVGAIVFTNDAWLEINPLEVDNGTVVLQKLGKIEYKNGGTSINKALGTLRDNIANVKGFYSNIKFAAFLISDGKANIGGDAYKEANALKQNHVEMYCIGITGRRNDEALIRLATKEENVLILRNYDALQWLAEILTNGTIDYSECGLSYSHNPQSGLDVDDSAAGRILGGDAAKTVWPWMVQIQIRNTETNEWEHICGGSIIHRKWVLTAAHCMHTVAAESAKRQPFTPSDLLLRAGLLMAKNETAKKLVVESIVIHKEYNNSTFQNDIALLRLRDEIVYEKSVRPICLPPLKKENGKNSSVKRKTAFVIGWGADTANNLKSTDSLMQLKMEIGSRDECNKSVQGHPGKVYPEQGLICAKSVKGDTCNGDSGGPLMDGVKDEETIWTQVGIVSWGRKSCREDKHSFYTDVSQYMDWINRHLENGSAAVENGTIKT
ncbi:complement factor B-like isoform X2 [Amblyomma americanum]